MKADYQGRRISRIKAPPTAAPLCYCCGKSSTFAGASDNGGTDMVYVFGCLWSVMMWRRDPIAWTWFIERMRQRRSRGQLFTLTVRRVP